MLSNGRSVTVNMVESDKKLNLSTFLSQVLQSALHQLFKMYQIVALCI